MKTTPLQVGSSAWYAQRAKETQYNGKTVSEHNYMLAMSQERHVIEVLQTRILKLKKKLGELQ
jgi:hypothetical protein